MPTKYTPVAGTSSGGAASQSSTPAYTYDPNEDAKLVPASKSAPQVGGFGGKKFT